jgi:hypothetical protein
MRLKRCCDVIGTLRLADLRDPAIEKMVLQPTGAARDSIHMKHVHTVLITFCRLAGCQGQRSSRDCGGVDL